MYKRRGQGCTGAGENVHYREGDWAIQEKGTGLYREKGICCTGKRGQHCTAGETSTDVICGEKICKEGKINEENVKEKGEKTKEKGEIEVKKVKQM